ncbi:hypothetical protein D3C71_598690 [compost metagenome]
MILRIQKSRGFKITSAFLVLNILAEIFVPTTALALTGGPKQPEFGSFTPIGVSDMVDLSSGDMNYNIPLMDVGGYPLNIAYSSEIGMDDEASWVGLGWNLSVGQINRSVRGLPDDFKGDEMVYENNMKPNITAGASFKLTPNLFGVEIPTGDVSVSLGVTAMYNNYDGFTMKTSVGVQMDLGKACSVGFNAENGPDGLSLSPSISIHSKKEQKDKTNTTLTGTVGVTMNSRQGLTATTLSMSKSKSKGSKEAKNLENLGSSSVGSSIGFTDELYTPSKRVAMNTESFTVNAALGSEVWGGEAQGQITAFGTIQSIDESELYKVRAAYGYENTDHSDKYGILDFNREKDGAFSVNTTNLPLTNYTYDIYSVQGQGVGGTYRPFRNQVGYVYDSYVSDGSSSTSLGVEIGMGNAVHGGVDFENTTINSHSGVWENENEIVQYLIENYNYNPKYEKVHFKNVGDLSVDAEFSLFDQTARYNPVRIPFVGNKFHRKAASKLQYKYNDLAQESSIGVSAATKRTQRKSRNQSIRNITIGDLKKGVGYGPCTVKSGQGYVPIAFPGGAKNHHTGEVQIIRNDGARYIYGLPLYNFVKKESSFSVDYSGGRVNHSKGLVQCNATDNSTSNSQLNHNFNRTTTPAYVHTYLLTSVLSTDYQDVKDDGPTDDDLGSYTKFTYTDPGNSKVYKWKVPVEQGYATYNPGLNTDKDDDEGSVIYGEKAQKYIEIIETKTHIAVFKLSDRKDALGVSGENGGVSTSSISKKLEKISLYSKPEYLALGSAAKPIKTVNFEYSYSLCPGVPNNNPSQTLLPDEKSNALGKLTLKKIYFTYRDSNMGKYTGYRFNYNEYQDGKDEYTGGNLQIGTNNLNNPSYNIKGYDSWGKYKPSGAVSGANTDPVTAAEFSFTGQNRTTQDVHSSVWCLKKINTPSGGQISLTYESDDYNYVQDKKALMMYKVMGAGDSPVPDVNSDISGELYDGSILKKHKKYLYVQVPSESNCNNASSSARLRELFFSNLEESLLQFRFYLNMTKQGGNSGSASNINSSYFDYVSGYCRIDTQGASNCKIIGNDKFISIPLQWEDREGRVNKQVNAISKAAWNFGRKYLSKQVYGTAPNGNSTGIQQIVEQMLATNTMSNLKEIFTGPNATLEDKEIGRRFVKDKSWVRLNVASGSKLGGGCRVKSVQISDIWGSEDPNNSMNPGQTGYQTMSYGQSYKYNLSDDTTDPLSEISSGVATYEPVGNKENPFVMPVVATTKHLLAPKDENYVEKPFGESFFPSPQVTYSRVSVANISGATNLPQNTQVKKLHKTGKVVSEFYTSRDYPTIVDQTPIQAKEDKKLPLASILKIKMKKHFTASQGYVVHLNDMNGKQKAQWVYAEEQQKPISGVTYQYASNDYFTPFATDRNKGKLNNNVPVVFPNGDIKSKTIGVEYDLVHDLRENASETQITGVNTNLAAFFIGIIPGLVPIPLPDLSSSEDQVRAVSSTKVINTFGILVETIAYDGDTKVSTKNIAWDAMTGEVLATETVDEYNDKYYTFNYPAHWFYKGMSQASINLGIEGKLGAAGASAQYVMQGLPSSYMSSDFLMAGDEIAYTHSSTIKKKAWVEWVQGNTFKLIDVNGNAAASISSGTDFTVVRSARRNLQSAGIMNVTLMHHPFKDTQGNYVTNLGENFLMGSNFEQWKIINAGAVDYSDNWPAGCECGLEGTNPFVKNEKGVWRVKSSNTYLTGRNFKEKVTPRMEGFFSTFRPMYRLTASHNWYKDVTNWTWVSEVSKYSAYGFEIENMDALKRYSAAQYGYNNTLPIAVGANLKYSEIAYDGFEDRGFTGCTTNSHFSFPGTYVQGSGVGNSNGAISKNTAHTGKYSIRVHSGSNVTMNKRIACPTQAQP